MDPTRPIRFFVDALFPPHCLACEAFLPHEESLCTACRGRIKLFDAPFCPECRARRPPGSRACHPKAPFLLFAAAAYDDPVMHALVHTLKYDFRRGAADSIALALFASLTAAEFYERLAARAVPAIIVPIPLHREKFRKRGFNQSLLIAQALQGAAARYGMPTFPIVENALTRTEKTRSQTECANAEERAKNVAGCFAVNDIGAIDGNNIILVDDVFTTGATMHEAARVLKQNGAKEIVALVAAKA